MLRTSLTSSPAARQNYWACMNLAANATIGGNYSRLITELDQMAAKGINHLRIMASSEGAPTPQPFRMRPALMEAPGQYNEDVFQGLDICLDELSKRGMRATMTLNNEWQWSGGFAQYVSWAQNNTLIPYPSSWNLSAPPQRSTPGTGWGNYTIGQAYNIFTDYAALMYNTTAAENWYKGHIATVINRRNTINNRTYSTDPTIMTWQLANEPQPVDMSYSDPEDPLFAWVDRISSYIHSLAPQQLISVGLESKQGELYFKSAHNKTSVSYATSHAWVQNWGIYDMYNSSDANLRAAQDFARAFVANTSRWSSDIGKPLFLEEFGMARDNWQNKDSDYPYLSSASTTHRDAYFRCIIGAVMDDFRHGGAYVGSSPWAYGGIWRPETQHANDFGMVWAGDPPHESPGWYDLYNDDTAMDIVAVQQSVIRKWISEQGRSRTEAEG
ncbi:glycoside hydrolase [Ophiobolus disseminans]|uniref:mannan endo-1,4-beta-mannosidase n=1 Tax=Ophiobolus disseminans TaxID=1469910 RepID=A0A6A6ZQN5_9PLEO|nr:glycoside hydrolase [Ophiobolus disseminans]